MPYLRVKNELPLIPGYASGGKIVSFSDAAAAPLNKLVTISGYHYEGTGTPSPENPFILTVPDSCTIKRYGEDELDNPQTYIISYGGEHYDGILDVDTGKMLVKRQYVNGGFTQYNQNNGYKAYRKSNLPPRRSQSNGWCNMISNWGPFSSLSMSKNIIQTPDELGVMYVAFDENYDINDVIILYDILNPFEIQLTPTQVSTIKGLNHIESSTGVITDCIYIRRLDS